MPERPRTARLVFPDPEEAYMAIHRLRGAGFPVDVSGSLTGDVVVRVQVAPARLEELTGIAGEHEGRIETDEETDAATD